MYGNCYSNFTQTEASQNPVMRLHKILINGKTYIIDVTWEKNLRNYLHTLHGLTSLASSYHFLTPEYPLLNGSRIDLATELRGYNKKDRKPPEILLDGKGRGRYIKSDIVSLKRDFWTIDQARRDLFGTKSKNYTNAYPLNYLKENKTGYKIKKLYYHFISPIITEEFQDFIESISSTYMLKEFLDCEIILIVETLNEYVNSFIQHVPSILHVENLNSYNYQLVKQTDPNLIEYV